MKACAFAAGADNTASEATAAANIFAIIGSVLPLYLAGKLDGRDAAVNPSKWTVARPARLWQVALSLHTVGSQPARQRPVHSGRTAAMPVTSRLGLSQAGLVFGTAL